MLKISDISGKRVYCVKDKLDRKGEPKRSKIGKVHFVVFTPSGQRVVGILVKQSDVVGMVKRPDVFVALDALVLGKDDAGRTELTVADDKGNFDTPAMERLGLDWDRCIMWAGMDAKTSDGKVLGFVSDAAFDLTSGDVAEFHVGDGGVAQSLVGHVAIPVSMLRGYSAGWMIVDPAAAKMALSGGAAAAAGEGYAKVKASGKKAVSKADDVAADALDRGSKGLGKMLGKARRAIQEATEDDGSDNQLPTAAAQGVVIEGPSTAGELHRAQEEKQAAAAKAVTYAPTSEPVASAATKKTVAKAGSGAKAAAKKKGVSGKDAAKVVGKQLGKTKGMFGSFMDEYRKASK